MRGRPLAFLMLVVVGWGTGRIMWLLPDEVVRPLTLASRDVLISPAEAETMPLPVAASIGTRSGSIETPAAFSVRPDRIVVGRASQAHAFPAVVAEAIDRAPVTGGYAPPPADSAPPGLPPILVAPASDNRWSGSAWMIARDGGGGSLLSPLLGGSQGGIRIAYRLDDRGRTALFGRVATPLQNGQAELAAGAQWRPADLPVTAYAEVRATRGQLAPAAGIFGGGAVALPSDLRLDGYGQVGVIRRDGVSGFGDAQVRLTRSLGRIDAGAGAWVAAQRGARRLDIGPSVALPLAADPLSFRVSLDWRHRIAGNARPANGPALSLGADF